MNSSGPQEPHSLPEILNVGLEFKEDELKEWQLTLLTSSDSPRRLEAFRRLLLAQVPRESKQQICRQVIQSDDVILQKEGLQALKGLGGDEKLLDNLIDLLSENPQRVEQAAHRLRANDFSDEQMPWILAFMVRQLGYGDQTRALSALCQTIQKFNQQIPASLVPELVKQVLGFSVEHRSLVPHLLEGWAQTPSQGKVLFEESLNYEVGFAGEWLLPHVVKSGYRCDELVRALSRQLNTNKALGDSALFGNFLVSLGEEALETLMDDFEKSCRPVSNFHVIAKIVSKGGLSPQLSEDVFDFCFKLMRSEAREILPTLLEFPIEQLGLDQSKRRLWLRELMMVREQISSEYLLNEIDYQIRQAGALASEVLEDLVNYGVEEKDRLHALQLLVEVSPENEQVITELSELLDRLIQANELDRGELIKLYRALWNRPSYPQSRREHETQEMMSVLWRKSRTLERLEALSGAVLHVSAPLATQVILAALDLLKDKLPKMESKSLKRKVPRLDESLLEQRFLVAALEIARMSFKRDDLLPDLTEQLAHYLLENWDGVKLGQISRGPDGTRFLIRALVTLAECKPHWRRPVIGSLMDELGFLEVQKGLIHLWDLLEESERQNMGLWLVERLHRPRELEEEELVSLFELSRPFLERCTPDLETTAAKIVHRLHSMVRFASHHVDRFMGSLKVENEKLSDLLKTQ